MAIEVYLDDRAFAAAEGASRTLGNLIDEARATLTGNDRVIVGVVCDGIDVTGQDLDAKMAESLDQFQRVDLQSGEPGRLVRDALEQARELLAGTEQRRQQAVDALTRGDQSEATTTLRDCFRDWLQVHTGIAQSLAFLELDPATFTVAGKPLEPALAGVTERLQQVREAIVTGDDVLLADTLQYEFDQITGTWKATIEAILAHTTQ